MHYSTVALIPARMGSKRIPGKNIKTLGGHPLIAYAIQSAKDANIFDCIYVSSDSGRILDIANYYGAWCIERPIAYALDSSPDSEWIKHALPQIGLCFFYAIVRPTNPFRTGGMIRRAWEQWDMKSIMKAVEPVKQHPYKMWLINKDFKYMITYEYGERHLIPTQTLNEVYIQNASLEWRLVFGQQATYQPFYTEGYEGFDLNTPEDWILAEALIEKGYAKLPRIEKEPYDFTTV